MYNMAIQQSAPLSSTIFYLSRSTIQKKYIQQNLKARSVYSTQQTVRKVIFIYLLFLQVRSYAHTFLHTIAEGRIIFIQQWQHRATSSLLFDFASVSTACLAASA